MNVSTTIVKALHQIVSTKKSVLFLNGLYGIDLNQCGTEVVFRLKMFPDMIAYDQSITTFFTLEMRTSIFTSVIEYLNLLKEQIVLQFKCQRIVLRLANGFYTCCNKFFEGWLNVRLLNSEQDCVAMIYGTMVPVTIDFTCDDLENRIEKHIVNVKLPDTSQFSVLPELAQKSLEDDEGFRMDTELMQLNKWGYAHYSVNLIPDGPDVIPLKKDMHYLNGFEDAKSKNHIISLCGHGVRFL